MAQIDRERVRYLVDSLPEPEIEGDAFVKTMAKLRDCAIIIWRGGVLRLIGGA